MKKFTSILLKKFTSILFLLVLLCHAAFAAGPITSIIPFGATNNIAAASTNDVTGSGTNTPVVYGLPASSTGFYYSLVMTGTATNLGTYTLYTDCAMFAGTNALYTNGYWNLAVRTNTVTANGTNPVVITDYLDKGANGGGAVLYKWRLLNTNAVSIVTNMSFAVYPR